MKSQKVLEYYDKLFFSLDLTIKNIVYLNVIENKFRALYITNKR